MTEQTGKPIQNVLILGGGTAGWLTATYLAFYLSKFSRRKCNITLVESGSLPTEGVGETSVPWFQRFFHTVGIPEGSWMSACDASFTLGSRFENWLWPDRCHYWANPFSDSNLTLNGFSFKDVWLAAKMQGRETSWQVDNSLSCKLMEMGRAPKMLHQMNFIGRGSVKYAYHFDAELFRQYCKSYCTKAGVQHMVDHVQDVKIGKQGFVESIRTEKHGELSAELFIDCTELDGLLINRALGESFRSYSDTLLCDRACVASTAHEDRALSTYTRATALKDGWMWRIPLQSRMSVGYVYSSAFVSDDEAEAELRAQIGNAKLIHQPKTISMRTGRTERPWVKNCVSIGSSAGSIEPLHSTDLYQTQRGIETLLRYFPDCSFSPERTHAYNTVMTRLSKQIRDFTFLHYYATQRADTAFWRANQHETRVPDGARHILDLWHSGILPVHESELFVHEWGDNPTIGVAGYQNLLLGMRVYPKKIPGLLQYCDIDHILGSVGGYEAKLTDAAKNHLAHRAYLDEQNSQFPQKELDSREPVEQVADTSME